MVIPLWGINDVILDPVIIVKKKKKKKKYHTLTAQSKPIYHWINVNRMVLNVDKIQFVLLGTCQKLHDALKNVSVGEDEYIVTPVWSHQLLQIHVDNTLSWKTHISHLCSKLSSRLYLFNQVKYLMPLSIRKHSILSVLVQPVIDYGCVIWGNCSRDLLIKVHKMMKMYARSIFDIKDKRQSSSVKLIQTLGWMPVEICIYYFTGIKMYNIIHGNAPSYLREMFKTNSQIHTHNTRNNKSLYLTKYNLVTGQKTFIFRGIKLWEHLTNNIEESLI